MTSTRQSPVERAGPLALGLIDLAYLAAAWVGLPLYGDGALYFVEMVLEESTLVPNGRLSAQLPQLPMLLAMAVTDDIPSLRLIFSLGYLGVPFATLVACWLAARRRGPGLLLFPLLFHLANQVNLSGVSELLLAVHLAWPLVLLALLHPERRVAWGYGVLLGPILLYLHPLAFGLSLGLALLAGMTAVRGTGRGGWWAAAGVLAAGGALRLGWSLIDANSYERAQLAAEGAARYYLAPASLHQEWLLAGVALLGLALALRRGCWVAGAGVLILAALVAADTLAGVGIKLKAAITYPLGVGLMALAVSSARWARAAPGTQVHPCGLPHGRSARALVLALGLAIALMLGAKALAWQAATRVLAGVTAGSPAACIVHGPETPGPLQPPEMAIVDNWTAPFAALVFRHPGPVALLLPGDGCARLAREGRVYLTHWLDRPWGLLEGRFGPLRRSPPLEGS